MVSGQTLAIGVGVVDAHPHSTGLHGFCRGCAVEVHRVARADRVGRAKRAAISDEARTVGVGG